MGKERDRESKFLLFFRKKKVFFCCCCESAFSSLLTKGATAEARTVYYGQGEDLFSQASLMFSNENQKR